MAIIVPAVLPSSRKDFEEKISLLTKIPSVTRIQIDIIDGLFTSPASWPFSAPQELDSMVKQGEMLPALDRISYEIDLMCLDAERSIGAWLSLGASRLTFHAESSTNLSKLLPSSKRRYGREIISFGCALNIGSDIPLIEPCIGEIEYVQFMGIKRIGRQGQPFDNRVLAKIKSFRARHPEVILQVDGGVSIENAKELTKLGVSDLIVGSAIIRAKNPTAAFAAFEALQTSYGV